MISLAIGILWFAVGVIILGGIIWLALYAIKMFLPVPAMVEKVIWVVFLILVLIYLLMTLQGGGTNFGHFRFGASQSYATLAAYPASTAADLQRLLT